MSQVQLTNDERIRSVMRFGYSEPEGRFLCLAALHGGYFLPRQYRQFLGKEASGAASMLVQKALAKDHLKAWTFLRNVNIYHLCARPFYAVLGQPDNRNRRERQPLTIKNKLMALDFVLAHPDRQYLATEQEKVAYFTARGIDRSMLPAKLYHAGNGQGLTPRFFVEKYPLFVSPEAPASSESLVSFCFVDEGLLTVGRFETFVTQYRPLLSSLSHFRMVYVAASPRLFSAAKRAFEHILSGQFKRADGTPRSSIVSRLLDHFDARNLYESHQFSSFDRAKLIRLRDDLNEFSGPEHQRLYERWKTEGPLVLRNPLEPANRGTKPVDGSFSHYLLEQNYDLFGTLTAL